jgi:PhzF family phenazine biosynthesis protein
VLELPFAGHPTLGTCHAWLEASGNGEADVIVQECAAGLVSIRRTTDGLAFAAPPLIRSGPVEESLVQHIADAVNLEREAIVDAAWADNGPGWVAILLADADAVLALKPGFVDLDLGVVGPYPEGSEASFEVRAFFPKDGSTVEDPVTGSLNASLAEWLLRTERTTAPYVASQGAALGRSGRVYISRDADGTIWVGGGTVSCIAGQVEL